MRGADDNVERRALLEFAAHSFNIENLGLSFCTFLLLMPVRSIVVVSRCCRLVVDVASRCLLIAGVLPNNVPGSCALKVLHVYDVKYRLLELNASLHEQND